MSNPLVSVIMPAYNHEHFIGQSIRSVINQDYDNIELVILNDGSRDRTDEVIRSLADECRQRFRRFEYINKANEGVARTMNQGVMWAQSEYVTSISSDDLMTHNKISSLLPALVTAGSEVGLAYADADFIDDAGQKVYLDWQGRYCDAASGYDSFIKFYTRKRKDVVLDKNSFDYPVLLRGNFLPGMAMMWRRSVLLKVGIFTPGIPIEDWDLWLRIAREHQGIYVPTIVASYRWHASNTVRTSASKLLEGQDYILLRELQYVSSQPALARIAARGLLKNALHLVLAKRTSLGMSRLCNLTFWHQALIQG